MGGQVFAITQMSPPCCAKRLGHRILGTFHRRIQVALKNANACFDAAITFTEAHKCVIYRT